MNHTSPENHDSVFSSPDDVQTWLWRLQQANDNNIWCHCQGCDYEWVDSTLDVPCRRCGSTQVEHIPCWQFPDD